MTKRHMVVWGKKRTEVNTKTQALDLFLLFQLEASYADFQNSHSVIAFCLFFLRGKKIAESEDHVYFGVLEILDFLFFPELKSPCKTANSSICFMKFGSLFHFVTQCWCFHVLVLNT